MSGKTWHSSVPRRKTGRPLTANCVPRAAKSRTPVVVCHVWLRPSCGSTDTDTSKSWGANSSQSDPPNDVAIRTCVVASPLHDTPVDPSKVCPFAPGSFTRIRILPCPLRPVALPIRAVAHSWRLVKSGRSTTSSIHTGGAARSSIFPTMPFRLPGVPP